LRILRSTQSSVPRLMRPVSIVLLIVVIVLAGCTRTIRTGALIDKYSNADCVPVKLGQPRTRIWDYTLQTREGISIHLSGAQVPGGRIDLRYRPSGPEIIAADAEDYIYPADVRVDLADENLYIRASGIPVFGDSQTWLFEYNLKKQQQTARARVDPGVLPQECPVNNSN